MVTRRHRYREGEGTATFEELDFQDQAKSITGQVSRLEASIRANLRRAREEGRDAETVRVARARQVERLLGRLRRTGG